MHRAAFQALCKAAPKDYQYNLLTGITKWSITMKLYEMFGGINAYCMPTTGQVEKNKLLFTASYNHSEPIAKLLRQFKDFQIISTSDGTPYTPEKLMQKFNALMELTGVYDDDITKWRSKPTPDKMWPLCQQFWWEAFIKQCISPGPITRTTGSK